MLEPTAPILAPPKAKAGNAEYLGDATFAGCLTAPPSFRTTAPREWDLSVMPKTAERARQASEIGTAITRLHRENYGRGATTTRTIFQGDDVITFLEDVYTPVERTLIDAGNWEQVKETRQAFQMAMQVPFTETVEKITGRTVTAFMSQSHLDPDLSVEIFVLEPDADGSES